MILTLSVDSDAEDPCLLSGWKLYSFNAGHVNFANPRSFGLHLNQFNPAGDPIVTNIGLSRKLSVGLAFLCSYVETSGVGRWVLRDSDRSLCRFDAVSVAGLLRWEAQPKDMGSKHYLDRAERAEDFLKKYTRWYNGDCYQFLLETDDGRHIIASCCGFFGTELIETQVLAELASLDDRPGYGDLEVTGDAAWLADNWDLARYRAEPSLDFEYEYGPGDLWGHTQGSVTIVQTEEPEVVPAPAPIMEPKRDIIRGRRK